MKYWILLILQKTMALKPVDLHKVIAVEQLLKGFKSGEEALVVMSFLIGRLAGMMAWSDERVLRVLAMNLPLGRRSYSEGDPTRRRVKKIIVP